MSRLETRLAKLESAAGITDDEPVIYSYCWRMPDGEPMEIARWEKRGSKWAQLESEDNPLTRAMRIRNGGLAH